MSPWSLPPNRAPRGSITGNVTASRSILLAGSLKRPMVTALNSKTNIIEEQSFVAHDDAPGMCQCLHNIQVVFQYGRTDMVFIL